MDIDSGRKWLADAVKSGKAAVEPLLLSSHLDIRLKFKVPEELNLQFGD